MTTDDATARREAALEALAAKTAREWNADPRNGLEIMSWSDFGRGLYAILPEAGRDTPITWTQFKQARRGATISMKRGFTWETIDRITPRLAENDD